MHTAPSESAGHDFAPPHRLDLERQIHDKGKHNPSIHAERAAFARHRHEMLRVGKSPRK